MAIGDNIRKFRKLKGMTQKELGLALGFDEKTADIRIAQYESGTRKPKEDMINDLSKIFDIRTDALTTPNIDSYVGLMHTLFSIEDTYGLKIIDGDDGISLKLDKNSKSFHTLYDSFLSWQKEAEKFENEEITLEEYNHWRFNYPKVEAEKTKSKRDQSK
ncbi:TPA: helix-turn-helix transcriptional regulator [Listeria monocytogenes]|nr:helix-turn-helix transcriptional regulator [Listeria monocytogenes]